MSGPHLYATVALAALTSSVLAAEHDDRSDGAMCSESTCAGPTGRSPTVVGVDDVVWPACTGPGFPWRLRNAPPSTCVATMSLLSTLSGLRCGTSPFDQMQESPSPRRVGGLRTSVG